MTCLCGSMALEAVFGSEFGLGLETSPWAVRTYNHCGPLNVR